MSTAFDARRLGRLLTEIETSDGRRPRADRPQHAARVFGVTGSAGSGKSTIVAALIQRIRAADCSVAALLIDPSSPVHGGALLGDRVRIGGYDSDQQVFIRSMATRGASGGIADAVQDAVPVLGAAGFDWVIVETVGIGQTDVAVRSVVDTTVLVFTPESGDEIQTEKSGVIEVADVLVVNKSDRDGSEAMADNLRRRAESRSMSSGATTVPVLCTVARTGEGVDELWRVIRDRPPRSRG
jgi:LAO/AO transport system kinase